MITRANSRSIEPAGQVIMDFFESLDSNSEIFLFHVRHVSDVAKSEGASVNLENTIQEIWTKMSAFGVSDLPVVDIEGDPRKGNVKKTYVGIVRKRDLAALGSRFVGALSQRESDDRMMQVRLSMVDVIDRKVAQLRMETSIFEAIQAMIDAHAEALAVVSEDGQYLSTLTLLEVLNCLKYMAKLQKMRAADESQEVRLVDLFSKKKGGSLPSDKMMQTFMGTARDVMDDSFNVIVASASVGEAMALMEREMCHSLIVVDDDGNLRGITTSTEIQLSLPPIERKGNRQNLKIGSIFKSLPDDSAETRQAKAERVAAVTQSTPEIADLSRPVEEIIDALLKPTAMDIPIMGSGNVIKGIVSRWDMAKAFMALAAVGRNPNA